MKLILTNAKIRRIAIVVLITVLAVGIPFGYYVFSTRYIKLFGITLTPSRDFPVADITYYLQNDPLWSSDKIGSTSSTLGKEGCLITCVAVSLNNLGIEITPKKLNQSLSDANGYQGADLIWYKINEVLPSADYSYERIFSSETIEKDLEDGKLPIVNIRLNGIVTHWVIIIGAENGEFLIFDPANKDKMPIPLQTHEKVYAYRVLQKDS